VTALAPSAPDRSDTPQRILVVDDQRSIREVFSRTLLFAGFDVVVASGGAEGLQRLGSDPTISLVLLDLDMPGVNGRRFREVQLGHPQLATIPTVIVTGVALDAALRKELQATGYAAKPIHKAELIALARKYSRPIGDVRLPMHERVAVISRSDGRASLVRRDG
jgi:CheY-like chemotaxis protein